jgi:polar amino acid transport system substrate-binding protein
MSRSLLSVTLLLVCILAPARAEEVPSRQLTVAIREAPPFAIKTQDGLWTGISADLWRHLAEQIGLRYRFIEATQDAMRQGLADGAIDVSLSAVTVTADRLRETDFTQPYFLTGIGVAVPKQTRLDWWGTALSLLTWRFFSLILGLAVVIGLVSLVMWFLERQHTAYFGGPPADGLVSSATWASQTMTRGAGAAGAPTTRSGRVLGAIWVIGSVALIASFTAAITSHLTAREVLGLVREEADLHKARVGAWHDSKATLAYLDRAHIAHRDFATLKDALQALADAELDAVVDDKPILAWQIHEAFPTELQMLDLRLDPGRYAIALPLNSELRQPLNIALIEALRTSWWQEVLGRYVGGE